MASNPSPLYERVAAVRGRIAAACRAAGRSADGVTLLAVGKTFPADRLREAHAAGIRAFGENYVQEALAKIDALADLQPPPEWHFIGPLQANKTRAVAGRFDWVHGVDRLKIAERLSAQRPAALGGLRERLEWHLIGPLQSNKTRLAAEHFDWVQSVDRLKIAQRLAEQRPAALAPLQVCLQVNISGEATKSGVAPAELPALAHAVAALPRLRLRGLMAIPEPLAGFEAQRVPHRALHRLWLALQQSGLALDTLSIGMSDDLEAAIAEGATLVRVGSAIFGRR